MPTITSQPAARVSTGGFQKGMRGDTENAQTFVSGRIRQTQNLLRSLASPSGKGEFGLGQCRLRRVLAQQGEGGEAPAQGLSGGRNAMAELTTIVDALKDASAEPRLWKRKPGRVAAPYLSWQTVAGLLERHAPGWSCSTTRAEIQDGMAVVTVSLCVAGCSREATAATALIETARDGTAYHVSAMESAERTALKRAAALFGVGSTPPQQH